MTMRQSDRVDKVEVWLAGRLQAGANAKQAALAFARAGNLEPQTALALISGGKPTLVAQGLPPETGRAYVEQLAGAGIVAGLRPMPAAEAPPGPRRPTPVRQQPTPKPQPASAPQPASGPPSSQTPRAPQAPQAAPPSEPPAQPKPAPAQPQDRPPQAAPVQSAPETAAPVVTEVGDVCEVWLTGRLLPGADPKQAALAFAWAGNLEPKTALALITGGEPSLVTQGLNQEMGRAQVEKLAAAGIAAELRPMSPAPQATPPKQAKPTPTRPRTAPVQAAPKKPDPAQAETCEVRLSGRLLPGADPKQAAQAFARAANLEPKVALALITGGEPRPLKQDLPPDVGQAYVDKLAALGIAAELRPMPRAGTQKPAPSRRADAPPSARAATEKGLLSQSGMWGEQAEELDADIGRNWMDESLHLFLTEIPVWWSALFLGCFLPSLALFLPFICTLFFLPTSVPQTVSLTLSAWLFPLFAGGFSLLAHRQKSGEKVRVGLALFGFWDNTVSLLVLGLVPLLYLGLLLAIHLLLQGNLPFVSTNLVRLLHLPRFLIKGWGYALLLSGLALPFAWMVLRLLLCAPCLVMLPGESPGRALRMSLSATGRNRGAFRRAWPLTLPMPFLIALLPVLAFFANRVYTALFLIFLLIPYFAWYSVFAYLACRDIFHDDDSDF